MWKARFAVPGTLIALLAAPGCRALPTNFDPPEPTYALGPATEGALAELAVHCAERLEAGESGFLLLDRNALDLTWRLALIDSAERSLDLQTYLWGGDFGGRLIMYRILLAAERGVRVRLLVDDFLLRGHDRFVAALDDHPNVELRIWNPGRQREIGRNMEYVSRLRELNHRMHNKVLIADNRVMISGGRNIASAYFGLSKEYNFLDLDLLAVGPVVPDASAMFDRYWNAEQAAPGRIFHPDSSFEDLPRLTRRGRRAIEGSPLREVFAIEPRDWEDLLADAVATLIPGRAEVIYDRPGEREPSQDAYFGLQRFFQRAEREVLAVNPYLVPAETFFEEAARLEAAGVHLAIMTNSLGSTNQTIVHSAYSRTRVPMLEAGVDVFEMRYDGANKAEIDTAPVKSKWVGLHGKAVVLDRRHVFIGSYNFSPRSKNLNTELGLIVDSPRLGAVVADFLEQTMAPENAWQLHLDEQGRLRWESNDGTLTTQPAQNFLRRFKNGIFSLFPLDEHI